MFLLDTNVLSELRKGERASPMVRAWFDAVPDSRLYTSVLVIGEIRRGVESIRRRDPATAASLEQWLRSLRHGFSERVLPVDAAVAEQWGRLNVPDPLPAVDGLLAATAIVRGMTLVTRNTKDVARSGAVLLNPFDRQSSFGELDEP